MDLTRQPSGRWIIDFGWEMSEQAAALYEAPYAYVLDHVRPVRLQNRSEAYRIRWWRHVEPRPGMWRAFGGRRKYIATSTVSKHRLFCWIEASVCPDHQLITVARDDDTSFGVLHSGFHEAMGASARNEAVGRRPRYTSTTTFASFPFPEGLTRTGRRPSMLTIRALSRSRGRRGGSMSCARRGSTRPISSSLCRRSCRGFPTASFRSVGRPLRS